MEKTLQGLDVAIQKVELEYQAVMNGTHHELHFRCAGLKRTRDQMRADARQSLANKEGLVEKLLDYERGQIEDSYCAAVDKVREKMDTELFAQVRVLEQRRDGKESDESRMSTRSLRSKKGGRADDDDDDDDDGLDRPGSIGGAGHSGGLAGVATAASSGSKEVAETAGKRRTKRALSPASMHLDKCLDEDEIKDDKYAIERDAEMQRRAEMMGQNGGKGISSGSSTNRKRGAVSSAVSSSSGSGTKKSGGSNTGSNRGSTTVAGVSGHSPLASSGTSSTAGSLAASAAASGERFVQVNIKQGQLQFENDLFLKGDPAIAQVVVADGKNAANSCVSGVISSINNSEVICIVHNLSLCQHVIFSLFSYDRFPK